MRPNTRNNMWFVLVTVAIGSFMATLDSSIINVSYPRLTRVFQTEASVVMWASVAYLLVSVSLMLTFGRIGDTYGKKRVYSLGFALYTLGMIACSVSQSIGQLIAARVFQGVGAAMVIGLGFGIAAAAFPPTERGKAMGILGAAASTGLLAGPAVGGFLLDALDWRAIFYARVPIGLIALVMTRMALKESSPPVNRVGTRLDIGGAAALFGTLSCLLLFFNFGGRSGFTAMPAPAFAAGLLASLGVFAILERRSSEGVIDFHLFRRRLFTAGSVSLTLTAMALSSMTFLGPFLLIDGIGYSASQAGLFIASLPLTSLAVAPLSGWLSDRVGARALCTAGTALVAIGAFLVSRLGADAGPIDLLPRLFIMGLGQGMFMSPNASSVINSVPRERLSTASAMIGTSRQIGMSVGTAIAGTIFVSRQLAYAASLGGTVAPTDLYRLSVTGGVQDTLLIAALICSIGIVTSFARGPRQPVKA